LRKKETNSSVGKTKKKTEKKGEKREEVNE
jgi:hypothetical protein